MPKLRNINYNHVRPCHVIGLFLKHADGNVASVDTLHDVLRNAGHAAHISRLSTLIWNLTKDPNHGGSEIVSLKTGREVIGYWLKTPERLNDKGQNIANVTQYIANLASLGKLPAKGEVNEEIFALGKKSGEVLMLTDETTTVADMMHKEAIGF